MKKLEMLFGVLRLPFDALAVSLALILSYHLRIASIDLIPGRQLLDPPVTLPPFDAFLSSFLPPAVLLFLAIALVLKLYAFHVTSSAWSEAGRVCMAVAVWLVCVMGWYFLVRKELFYSRILLIHSVVFTAVFVLACRAVLTLVYRFLLRLGYGIYRVVSVGERALSASARRTLQDDVRYRYLGHAPTLAALTRHQESTPLDLAIQTDPDPTREETLMLIEYCRSEQIAYAFLPPLFADTPHQLAVERLGLLPMVRFRPTPLDGWGRVIKRISDVLGSLVLLILLSPLFLVIAILILLDAGWPVFYVSRRIGDQGRKRISVLKFRSMVVGADAKKPDLLAKNHRVDGPLFKMRDDPRVTRTGRMLRSVSLDELPQLLNVFAGQMSLVGPRPHLPDEVRRYTSYQKRVFAVRPGMTGLAQISGRSDLKFEDEVRFDLQYIEEWSFLLDLWILWRTLVVVVGRRGAD